VEEFSVDGSGDVEASGWGNVVLTLPAPLGADRNGRDDGISAFSAGIEGLSALSNLSSGASFGVFGYE
jgi:hypothetical protein